jgi:hypothetical protein
VIVDVINKTEFIMLRIFTIFFILFVGCNSPISYTEYANSVALMAKYTALNEDEIIDGVKQSVGDKCRDCNSPPGKCGVGRVGDGTICVKCENCGGDGIIHEMDINDKIQDNAIIKDEIKMLTRDDCKHCDVWKLQVQPLLVKKGWKIKPIEYTGSVPVFQFYNKSGEFVEYNGYMPIEKFSELYSK